MNVQSIHRVMFVECVK